MTGCCDSCDRAERYIEAVDIRLRGLLAVERRRWQPRYPSLAMGFDAVEDFVLGGGKRLRPRFAFWGHEAVDGRQDLRALVDLGAAIELFHAFALIHDDVMDASDTRRHAPTVHHRFAALHRAGAWAGEQRRVSEAFAMLLGDLAFAYSTQLLSELPERTRVLFDEMRVELHVGQYLDLVGAARAASSAELDAQAGDIARFKTATYSVQRPLHLGSSLGGNPCLDEWWTDYGMAVGEAFQLRDDLLDVFGDPAVTGKPIGGDLNAGTSTLLLQRTRAAARAWRAEPTRRRRSLGPVEAEVALDALDQVGSGGLDCRSIAAVGAFMTACGAVDEVEARIRDLVRDAHRTLAEAPIPPAVEHGLAAMADTAAWRVR